MRTWPLRLPDHLANCRCARPLSHSLVGIAACLLVACDARQPKPPGDQPRLKQAHIPVGEVRNELEPLGGGGKAEPDAPHDAASSHAKEQSITSLKVGDTAAETPVQMPPSDTVPGGETARALAQQLRSQPALKKLDAHLMEALQKTPATTRETSPDSGFDIRTLGIVSDGTRVLVDLDAAVNDDLLNHITRLGGKVVATSPEAVHAVRVMIPLTQLASLAASEDVKTITPAQVSITKGVLGRPSPANGASILKP